MNSFLAFVGVFLLCIGCSNGKNGSNGAAGAIGPQGPSDFQATYQNGQYPDSSYSGELDDWVSGQYVSTQEGSSPYLKITTQADQNTNGYTRTLVQFTNLNLPSNITVLAAQVWIKLESATSVSGSVTIGCHAFSSSIYPTCAWGNTVTWNGDPSWKTCDNDNTFIQDGFFNTTPMSTVVFTTSENDTTGIYAFDLAPSVVQSGISQGVVQFVLRSEGEPTTDTGSSTDTGTSLIAFYPNTDTSGNAPKLLITYE